METTRRRARRDEIQNTLDRTTAQRDGCLANLVRYEAKIKKLRQQLARAAKAVITSWREPPRQTESAPIPAPALQTQPVDTAEGPDGIPPFLDRRPKGMAMAPGAAAAVEVRAEQAERRKAKSRGRIAKMKAKAAGDTKRMPLTGKAAMEFIRSV